MILIVEDEKNILELIEETLILGNYKTDSVQNGKVAIEKINKNNYQLVILDIMLPEADGFEIASSINKKGTPIMFLSAKNDVGTIVKGLKNGGQDYMTKPFEPLELLARIELILARNKTREVYKYQDISVNKQERTVLYKESEISLAPKEFDLLVFLLEHLDQALSRDKILEKVWGIDADIETRTVDYHIQRLRKKLHLESEIITVNKFGYRLEKRI